MGERTQGPYISDADRSISSSYFEGPGPIDLKVSAQFSVLRPQCSGPRHSTRNQLLKGTPHAMLKDRQCRLSLCHWLFINTLLTRSVLWAVYAALHVEIADTKGPLSYVQH